MKYYALSDYKTGKLESYSERLGCFGPASERDIFSEKALSLLDVNSINSKFGANAEWRELIDNPQWYVHKWVTPTDFRERKKPYAFIKVGNDYDYKNCRNLAEATEYYRAAAVELDKYGQKIEATVHLANCENEIHEYPDYVLSLNKLGGVTRERT